MSKMPIIFVGHGSPMNAIEENKFTEGWRNMAKKIPKPKAILVVSAHWYTKGTYVLDDLNPKTTYDMYGFPEELYKIVYNSPGSPEFAHITQELIDFEITIDNSWGYDHGNWSVLHHMFPNRDIPVFQLSIDYTAPAQVHYDIGKQINSLREQGVLIVGSGNIVHNLRMVDWSMENSGFGWVKTFDKYILENIKNKTFENIINYQLAAESAALAVPITDHFYPLLYVLGALDDHDQVSVYNESYVLGSLSMTSYLFQS